MKIIVGLGNPGEKYEKTRHNAGFDVIDLLAETYGIETAQEKHRAKIGKGRIEGVPVLLVKPQTFMNLSGESVAEILHYYKADPEEDLLVISDDVTLDVGMLRVRRKGSAGGHNGLKNIIEHCGTQEFPRLRVGGGHVPPECDMIRHVLGRLPAEERPILEKACRRAVKAVACILTEDVDTAMNLYNGKVSEE